MQEYLACHYHKCHHSASCECYSTHTQTHKHTHTHPHIRQHSYSHPYTHLHLFHTHTRMRPHTENHALNRAWLCGYIAVKYWSHCSPPGMQLSGIQNWWEINQLKWSGLACGEERSLVFSRCTPWCLQLTVLTTEPKHACIYCMYLSIYISISQSIYSHFLQ